jgi:hypothetical protein
MRTLGDFGILVSVLGAGLALTACGTSANPASTPAPATNAQAASHAAATAPGATEAPASAQLEGTAASATPTATATATPPSAPAAPEPRTTYGNPNGHAAVPAAGRAVSAAHPNRVIGNSTPQSCTSAAVVRAVAKGGVITFNCGPKPVTIVMTHTAKVVNTHRRTVIDGGGMVTLSGGGKTRILYMNTCDPKQVITTSDCWEQKWPQLVVQNLTFTDAYSAVRETKTSSYGGGAIFDQGGQLKVVNSGFINNRCYRYGPDLGGAAIRALGMYAHRPVYITSDTFRGGRCSNGGALSGLFAGFDVTNSLFAGNRAIGFGANPSSSGTRGGGSGGAIYTDGGENYNVIINGTVMRNNHAREGGGAIFFVIDTGDNGQKYHGNITLENDSHLRDNPNGEFGNAPGIFDSVDQVDTAPVIESGSTDS